MLTRMTMYILALSDSLKEKDVQSTDQSCPDIMNCLKDLIPLMVRIRREPGINCKILDYVHREGANSAVLQAFRENECLVGTH